ncbi:hypothetical protein ACFWP7_09335 [Streptomyces sp. NPDC058470]|uniref:hypothetical protein n=1 Tax=Streptomyces sp. NPDC058470 TaxID=3346515 RepID=UPI003648642E
MQQDPARTVGCDLDEGDFTSLPVEDHRLDALPPGLRVTVHHVQHHDVHRLALRHLEGLAVDRRTSVVVDEYVEGGRRRRGVVRCVVVLCGGVR